MKRVIGTLAVALTIATGLYVLTLLLSGLFWYIILWLVSWLFNLTSIFGLTLWQASGVMVLIGVLLSGLKRGQ